MYEKKPCLIIRRSGYYVNCIPNMPDARRKWMENNLTRCNASGRVLKDGSLSGRDLIESMRVCFVSFTPASAWDVENAPVFVPSLAKQYGMVRS